MVRDFSHPFFIFCQSIFSKNDYLFVFVTLRPKSTAMVIAGRSVHLTTHDDKEQGDTI